MPHTSLRSKEISSRGHFFLSFPFGFFLRFEASQEKYFLFVPRQRKNPAAAPFIISRSQFSSIFPFVFSLFARTSFLWFFFRSQEIFGIVSFFVRFGQYCQGISWNLKLRLLTKTLYSNNFPENQLFSPKEL